MSTPMITKSKLINRAPQAKLTITNGLLAGARFVRARSFGGKMKPELIVVHDTAGRLEPFNSVSWFQSKECKTSAHFVVERDGTITQMVPTDCKAFHAGRSSWKGRTFCNSFSIGIEIVNPGKCDASGKAWFGATGCTVLEKKTTKEHGTGHWAPYTKQQITAVKKLCRALCEEYADVNEIVTHWMISPGRKVDTNPLFPLDEVRAYALGEHDDESQDEPIGAVVPPMKPAPATPIPRSQRETITASQLRAAGSETIKGADIVTGVSAAGGVASSITGLAQHSGTIETIPVIPTQEVIEQIRKGTESVDVVTAFASSLKGFGALLISNMWVFGVLCAVVGLYAARNIIRRRVHDARAGLNIARLGKEDPGIVHDDPPFAAGPA